MTSPSTHPVSEIVRCGPQWVSYHRATPSGIRVVQVSLPPRSPPQMGFWTEVDGGRKPCMLTLPQIHEYIEDAQRRLRPTEYNGPHKPLPSLDHPSLNGNVST